MYDTKGWADGFPISASEENIETIDIILNYLTLPVMANWHFNKNRDWYLHFGTYAGFLTNAIDSVLSLDLRTK